jgi:hypothetical protein
MWRIPVIFSLDYDDTYTKDPEFWNSFIALAAVANHEVYCVTFRFPHELAQLYQTIGKVIGDERVIATSHRSKRVHMERLNIEVDVWIDDLPELIVDPVNTRFYDPAARVKAGK